MGKAKKELHPLKKYLSEKEIDASEFSKQVGCSLVQLYRIMAGTRFPSRELAARIEKKTKGAVLAPNLFFPRSASEGQPCR